MLTWLIGADFSNGGQYSLMDLCEQVVILDSDEESMAI